LLGGSWQFEKLVKPSVYVGPEEQEYAHQ